MAISPRRTERWRARIEPEHLERLSEIAAEDHRLFFAGHPEYRGRLLAVVLAQGAAQHYIDGKKGVKDLDVWSFFKAIPGKRFPADKRETHADFGPSSLGRQLYRYEGASAYKRSRFRKWEGFEGRRVDLLMRALPASRRVDPADALRDWLEHGAGNQRSKPPSSWWLAKQAVVVIDPASRRGEVVWPKDLAEALEGLSRTRYSVAEAERRLVAKAGLYAIYGSRQVWRELGLGRPPDERPL